MPKLAPKPKFITFDCYGTLVQWHRALQTAVRTVLEEHVAPSAVSEGRITDTVAALRTVAMEQQQRRSYRDYKTILRSSRAEVLAGEKLSLGPDDGETLLSCLRTIPPHPEVPAALQRCR
jgi:2-haloacid dehalogenase